VAQLPPGWPLIQGIDAQGASKRLRGDSALLLSVLRSLLAEFADLAQEGGVSSGGSPSALAARLHKLQGSAGVIGIDGVRQQAGEGEAALKDGDTHRADRALRALGAALRNLQAAAQPFFDVADATHVADDDAAPVDPDALASLIDLLRKQSMAAMPLFDELGPSLRSSLGSERFAALERAMQALQFRQAVEILQIGQGA